MKFKTTLSLCLIVFGVGVYFWLNSKIESSEPIPYFQVPQELRDKTNFDRLASQSNKNLFVQNNDVRKAPITCESFQIDNEDADSMERDTHIASLMDADDLDDKLAYALFNEFDGHAEKLSALLALGPLQNPLYAIELIQECTLSNNKELCGNQLIEDITQAHRDDGQIWLQAIHYYAKTQQDLKIMEAIEQSRQSKYFTAHIPEFIKLYTSTLEHAGLANYKSNAAAAFIKIVMNLPDYQQIADWCKNNVTQQSHAQSCLYLGRQLEQSATTEIDKMMGLGIQKLIYELEGSDELAGLTNSRIESRRNKLQDTAFNEMLHTIFNDETLLRAYIESFAELGEFGALQSLQSEVHDYRLSETYQNCNALF